MSSAAHPEQVDDVDSLLPADDAAEEIDTKDDEDMVMDSDGDEGDEMQQQEEEEEEEEEEELDEEVMLQNDSIAYFDLPQDSLFAIAQHPLHACLIA
ncbi:hypothetical protein E4U41_000641, partial [Claviceps citrina]